MINVEFIEGGQESIYLIQPLWHKLRIYHENKSKYFVDTYANKRFQDRVNELTADSKVGIRVDLVKDKDIGQYIGYCVSTIDKETIGEIDSLYVEKDYRNHGIGNELMKRALEWLDENKVTLKRVVVAEGNEKAIDFYNHYGFRIRKMVLVQISD